MNRESRCGLFGNTKNKPAKKDDSPPKFVKTPENKESSKSAKRVKPSSAPSPNRRCYRNPFLIFLSEFRRKHSDMTLTQSSREAAKIWRSMDKDQKAPYYARAKSAPKKPRKSRRKQSEDSDGSFDSGSDTSASDTASRSRSRSASRGAKKDPSLKRKSQEKSQHRSRS